MTSITWDRKKLERLRRAYDLAKMGHDTDDHVFVFDGHEFLVSYAKYLLEYLDGVFQEHHSNGK